MLETLRVKRRKLIALHIIVMCVNDHINEKRAFDTSLLLIAAGIILSEFLLQHV